MSSSADQLMHFFGVRTSGSSSLKLFPKWVEALGIEDARIEGVDIDLDAPPEVYRDRLQAIKQDPNVRGALVTSHKLNVISAAEDLFDERSSPSQICSEVSCIYKDGEKLVAHAPDAECALRIQKQMLGEDYWSRHPEAELLLLGSGGASAALVLAQTLDESAGPVGIKVVDINPERLAHLEKVSANLSGLGKVETILNESALDNNKLVASLPPFSIIVNATGMGKDLPGSPLADACDFPENSVAWELNYRGPRLFMAQAENGGAKVEDGWDLFVMNWYTVISTIFGLEISNDKFKRFSDASQRPAG